LHSGRACASDVPSRNHPLAGGVFVILDVTALTTRQLEEGAAFFEEHGYVRLKGLATSVAPAFERSLAQALGISDTELLKLLDPQAEGVFPRDVRARLSRIRTSGELARTLLESLSPLLTTVLGPMVHVSSTYHGQFKGGALSESAQDIAHYHNETAVDYMEVHGVFRLHQDFTGASLPTSPSGVTLWVALNECPDSTLKLFPGSHRLGLFCHKMWKSDDPRLSELGRPVEIAAAADTGVLFNALLFHGTGRVAALRRASCDLRFFPLCGFLPSEAHILDPEPVNRLTRQRERAPGPTTESPLLESLAFLGKGEIVDAPARSPLNWSNYVVELMRSRPETALPYLERFINMDLLEEPSTVLTNKFHNRTIHIDRLQDVQERAGVATLLN
jgi:hypothetical protein